MIKGKGGNSAGVPPLPIPNRAVKPRRADGTGKPGEQVAAPLLREKWRQTQVSLHFLFFMPRGSASAAFYVRRLIFRLLIATFA